MVCRVRTALIPAVRAQDHPQGRDRPAVDPLIAIGEALTATTYIGHFAAVFPPTAKRNATMQTMKRRGSK